MSCGGRETAICQAEHFPEEPDRPRPRGKIQTGQRQRNGVSFHVQRRALSLGYSWAREWEENAGSGASNSGLKIVKKLTVRLNSNPKKFISIYLQEKMNTFKSFGT